MMLISNDVTSDRILEQFQPFIIFFLELGTCIPFDSYMHVKLKAISEIASLLFNVTVTLFLKSSLMGCVL